jgi:YD repeat-containing protein
MVQNGDNTWTQARPTGFQFRYDTGGMLKYMANPAGKRTSVVRSGNLISYLVSPFNRRTSYAYDGSNNLHRVTDAAGRVTSFTGPPPSLSRRSRFMGSGETSSAGVARGVFGRSAESSLRRDKPGGGVIVPSEPWDIGAMPQKMAAVCAKN